MQQLGAQVTVSDQFEQALVKKSFSTIVVDGDDFDCTLGEPVHNSHILVLGRNVQIAEKLPRGLTFLLKPIKFRRLLQYLLSIHSNNAYLRTNEFCLIYLRNIKGK